MVASLLLINVFFLLGTTLQCSYGFWVAASAETEISHFIAYNRSDMHLLLGLGESRFALSKEVSNVYISQS